jgi:hypothetical protein
MWEGESMIDPVQLPILLKAIDFVFDEGRKILEERRERRKQHDSFPNSDAPEPVKDVKLPDLEQGMIMKQTLLASKVDETLWLGHAEEVKHLVRLLETYSRNYQLAKEQYAKWGSALVPPIIVNNMKDAENSMLETTEKLQNTLSRVYNKNISLIE